MDYTSHTAAIWVPIAAFLGVIGMIGVLWWASRGSAAVPHPPRPAHHPKADLPHRGDLPVGGAATIGTQRTGSEPAETRAAASEPAASGSASR